MRHLLWLATFMLGAACAAGPRPGDPGYPYNVQGQYSGRLMVGGEPFDATFDLSTRRGGRVLGSFAVRAPLEIEGRADGTVVDDLLRITLTYQSAARGGACDGSVEGILTVTMGGAVVDGPVTITDCGDALSGRMSFRRRSD